MRVVARVGLLALLILGGCSSAFDFPPEAPVPPGAKVLATDMGSDDDDGRIRVRVQVVEVPGSSTGELDNFYQSAHPGWTTVKQSAAGLCLTTNETGDYEHSPEPGSHAGPSGSRSMGMCPSAN